MDIDISDILAEVSKPTPQSNKHYGTTTSLTPTYDSTSSYTDHQLLVRAWTSERCSPSLLPYPSALIERIMSRIQTQISRIEDLTSGVDYNSNNNSNGAGATGGRGNTKLSNNTNLILSIIQTDLSRTQFIIRSYLRQRLDKITRDAGWFLKYHVDNIDDDVGLSSTSSLSQLLSSSEIQFLKHHQSLLSEFYDSSFLAAFPENLRRLDDSAGGVSMVEAPDGGMGVVVRCLREEWGNGEDVDSGVEGIGGEEGPDVELRFRQGEVWVVRWRDVRKGVVEGDLECL